MLVGARLGEIVFAGIGYLVAPFRSLPQLIIVAWARTKVVFAVGTIVRSYPFVAGVVVVFNLYDLIDSGLRAHLIGSGGPNGAPVAEIILDNEATVGGMSGKPNPRAFLDGLVN